MTKAQLLDEVKRLKNLCVDYQNQEVVKNIALEAVKRNDVALNIREKTGLHAWIARNDPGEPVCVGGGDGGLGVSMYYDDGVVVGVTISSGPDIIAGAGFVPYLVLQEEADLR